MMKKVFALFLSVVVVASICCVPAMAAEIDYSLNVAFFVNNLKSDRVTYNTPISRSVVFTSPSSSDDNSFSGSNTNSYGGNLSLESISPTTNYSSTTVSGDFGLYLSFFPYTTTSFASWFAPNAPVSGLSTVSAYYYDFEGVAHIVDSVSATSFSGQDIGEGGSYGQGITLSLSVPGIPESTPYKYFGFSTPDVQWAFKDNNGSSNSAAGHIYVTSYRAISTVIPGDIQKLEDIANGIVETNEILRAMYGDIMAILNQIYQATGSLLTAQNLTNNYLSQILPLIQSIDTTTTNIYSLLSTQFQLLISTIQLESDDIQGAIDAAVSRLIAYLDNVFSGAVGSLPGETDTMEGVISQEHDFQATWETNASDRVKDVDFVGFAFPTAILSGLGFVGIVFGNLWRNLGEYQVIFTFPLFLGLALLIIGKISKSGGRDSSSMKVTDEERQLINYARSFHRNHGRD